MLRDRAVDGLLLTFMPAGSSRTTGSHRSNILLFSPCPTKKNITVQTLSNNILHVFSRVRAGLLHCALAAFRAYWFGGGIYGFSVSLRRTWRAFRRWTSAAWCCYADVSGSTL
jgi:hypothetical protein